MLHLGRSGRAMLRVVPSSSSSSSSSSSVLDVAPFLSLSLSLFVSSRPRSIVSLPLEESARSRRCPVRPIDDELLLLLLYRSSISNPPSAAKPLLSSRGRFGVCICIYVCMLCYHALVHAARHNKLGGRDESR